MSNFSDLFIYLDFFGTKPGFYINGCDSHRSIFGAIISIVVCLIIFTFFCTFLNQIVRHNKPSIVHNEYIDDNPSRYDFDNNFVFTFSLQHPNYTNYINENIYTISAKKVTYVLDDINTYKTIETDIEFVRCNKYNFTVIPEYFEQLNIENLYCLNLNGVFIQGEYGKNYWQTINIYFNKCIKTTENNCTSEDEIDEILMGGYIDIFLTDFKIILNNFNNPKQIYGKNIFAGISIKHYSDLWLYLKRREIITDIGLVFTDYKRETCLVYDKLTETQYFRNENINFLTLIVRLSTNREEIFRSYLKLYEAAANVGGVVKIMFSIGEIINYLIKLTLYKNYLLQFLNMDCYFGSKIKKKIGPSTIKKILPALQIEKNNKILQNLQNKRKNDRDYLSNNQLNKLNVILQTSTELLKNNVSFPINNNYTKQNSIFTTKKNNNLKKIDNNDDKNIEKKEVKKPIINNFGPIRKIKNNKSISNIICSKSVFSNFKEINKRFWKIKFLLEISYYFKLININNYLKNQMLKKDEVNLINKIYHFNYHYDKDQTYYSQINEYFGKFSK